MYVYSRSSQILQFNFLLEHKNMLVMIFYYYLPKIVSPEIFEIFSTYYR